MEETTKLNGEEIKPDKHKKDYFYFILMIVVAIVVVAAAIGITTYIKKEEAKVNNATDTTASTTDTTDTTSVASVSEEISEKPQALPEHEGLTISVDTLDSLIVNLADYQNRSVTAVKSEITDDEVEYYVNTFFAEEGAGLSVDVASEGDTVTINYVGTIDGVAFNGGTADDQKLTLGSHSYIDGFEDGLVGATVGETRELNLKFPDNYGNTDLAGKDCVFTVTVTAITPGISDEAIALLNNENYSNLAEYRAFIKNELEVYYQENYEDEIVYTAIEAVMTDSEFAVLPDSVLDPEKETINNAYYATAASYGLDVATLLSYYGTDLDSLAEYYAKQKLVFYKIAVQEGLYPDDEVLKDFFINELHITEAYSSVEEYYAEVTKDYAIQQCITYKVYDYMLEKVTVTAE